MSLQPYFIIYVTDPLLQRNSTVRDLVEVSLLSMSVPCPHHYMFSVTVEDTINQVRHCCIMHTCAHVVSKNGYNSIKFICTVVCPVVVIYYICVCVIYLYVFLLQQTTVPVRWLRLRKTLLRELKSIFMIFTH